MSICFCIYIIVNCGSDFRGYNSRLTKPFRITSELRWGKRKLKMRGLEEHRLRIKNKDTHTLYINKNEYEYKYKYKVHDHRVIVQSF